MSMELAFTCRDTAFRVKTSLNVKVLPPARPARRVLLALHGYGDSAENFSGILPELQLEDTVCLVPQAPIDVPFSGGGAAWYPLFEAPFDALAHSNAALRGLMAELVSGLGGKGTLPPRSVTLLGFSQGAMLAFNTSLSCGVGFGATVALGGYLSHWHRLPLPLPEQVKDAPLFVGHGLQDQVVLPVHHFESLDVLQYLGCRNVTAKQYRGLGHGVSPEEISDVRSFLGALP